MACFVMRGLDPRIHHFTKTMDCRVKPGNDGVARSFPAASPCGTIVPGFRAAIAALHPGYDCITPHRQSYNHAADGKRVVLISVISIAKGGR
jgi:hypothetical protein